MFDDIFCTKLICEEKAKKLSVTYIHTYGHAYIQTKRIIQTALLFKNGILLHQVKNLVIFVKNGQEREPPKSRKGGVLSLLALLWSIPTHMLIILCNVPKLL